MLILILSILSLLATPGIAYAWGPASHLEFASRTLECLALFPPLVKRLLSRYQDNYFYGSLAADITLGKALHGYLHNCHNWGVALSLYHHKATHDRQRAFMLGYLGHLASDTVSHNFFVPYKLIRSWRSRLMRHVYWEIRMDLSVPERYWKIMDHLKDKNFDLEDALLEGFLKKTLFSFRTSKKIYNSLLVLQRVRHYQQVARRMAHRSNLILSAKDIKEYKTMAVEAAVDFMKHGERSFALRADPTGRRRILYAREMARKIRRAEKRGELSDSSIAHLLKDMRLKLRKGIYQPVTLPQI